MMTTAHGRRALYVTPKGGVRVCRVTSIITRCTPLRPYHRPIYGEWSWRIFGPKSPPPPRTTAVT